MQDPTPTRTWRKCPLVHGVVTDDESSQRSYPSFSAGVSDRSTPHTPLVPRLGHRTLGGARTRTAPGLGWRRVGPSDLGDHPSDMSGTKVVDGRRDHLNHPFIRPPTLPGPHGTCIDPFAGRKVQRRPDRDVDTTRSNRLAKRIGQVAFANEVNPGCLRNLFSSHRDSLADGPRRLGAQSISTWSTTIGGDACALSPSAGRPAWVSTSSSSGIAFESERPEQRVGGLRLSPAERSRSSTISRSAPVRHAAPLNRAKLSARSHGRPLEHRDPRTAQARRPSPR